MREFRRKQKKLKRIMNFIAVTGALFMIIYIGAQPYIAKLAGETVDEIIRYLCDFIVIGVLSVVFIYYSKYSKTDGILTLTEYELSDCGYYLCSKQYGNADNAITEITDLIKNNGYSINTSVQVGDFVFDVKAQKGKNCFYIIQTEDTDRNDVLAYLDCVINDFTVKNLKRRGNIVICFVSDNVCDDAIALSKMITTFGKREQIKIAFALVEAKTSKCYFLGNIQSACQSMIAEFILRADLPIKEEYKSKGKLAFQEELEERMKNFSAKEYLNGNFQIH